MREEGLTPTWAERTLKWLNVKQSRYREGGRGWDVREARERAKRERKERAKRTEATTDPSGEHSGTGVATRSQAGKNLYQARCKHTDLLTVFGAPL